MKLLIFSIINKKIKEKKHIFILLWDDKFIFILKEIDKIHQNGIKLTKREL